MPRIASRIQQQPFGTYNPGSPGRAIRPALQYRGPALPQEMFDDPELDAPTKRALIQVQNNTRQALSQVKGSAFAYANIIAGWTLTNGGANGASPNVVAHGLGQPATGAVVLTTYGGYLTAQATIPGAANANLIQVWTQYTAFAGVTAVTADILVYA
jgi:hypothetical protein